MDDQKNSTQSLNALLEMADKQKSFAGGGGRAVAPAPEEAPAAAWRRNNLKKGDGLEFENLSYSVTKKKKEKGGGWSTKEAILLDDLSGQAHRGHVTAVLGPSGAGKSTFLDALAGRIDRGSLRGSVRMDGMPVTASYMKKVSSYVMQDDQLFPTLTVFETLMFAAQVRLPPTVSRDEKAKRVSELLDQLGLRAAAQTYIGDEGRRGVSGGERRRVSIGVDIIHCPSLLFLDEPTSGLDSTGAFTVVEKVREIAAGGSAVLMTIHQPSNRIQSLLDRVIVLARGRLIYMGPPETLAGHLSGFGRPVPDGEDSIEHLLDVIKAYDESTAGLDPLVYYQRHGLKPSETTLTPKRRSVAASWRRRYVVVNNDAFSSNSISAAAANFSNSFGHHEDDDDDEEDDEDEFEDVDIRTKTIARRPLDGGGSAYNRRLPGISYRDFSVWIYNGVTGTPRQPPPCWTPSTNFVSHDSGSRHSPSYQQGGEEEEEEEEAAVEIADDGDDTPKFANPWHREVAALSWRTALVVARTPELFLSREVVLATMAAILSTLFRQLHTPTLATINHVLNFYIFAVCLVFFSSNDAVPAFIQERFIFIRETSHNAYRASAYVISTLIVYLPFFAAQALTFATITKLALCIHGGFFNFWAVLYASLITTNAYVMLVSALVPSYVTGYAVVIATTALFFLSSGFFLRGSLIPPYWRWLHYVSAMKYPYEALLTSEFQGSRCYSGDLADLSLGPLGGASFPPPGNGSCTIVGDDVLSGMGIGWRSVWSDVAVLLAWGVLYRFIFYIVLRFYSKNQRK